MLSFALYKMFWYIHQFLLFPKFSCPPFRAAIWLNPFKQGLRSYLPDKPNLFLSAKNWAQTHKIRFLVAVLGLVWEKFICVWSAMIHSFVRGKYSPSFEGHAGFSIAIFFTREIPRSVLFLSIYFSLFKREFIVF